MSKWFRAFDINANLLGGWPAFFNRRPNGYLEIDDKEIIRDISRWSDYSPASPLVTQESNSFLNNRLSEVSNTLEIAHTPRVFMAIKKRDKSSDNADYMLTETGDIPYVVFSTYYMRMIEYSPVYRGLVDHLLAHELQHGNQPDLFKILQKMYSNGESFDFDTAIEKGRRYIERTTALTSPSFSRMLYQFIHEIETESPPPVSQKNFRKFEQESEYAIEYDSDVAWARKTGDYRGAMQELAFEMFYRNVKNGKGGRNAETLLRNIAKDMAKPGKSHPSDLQRITKLGLEEQSANAIPSGSEVISNESQAKSWVERYAHEVYQDVAALDEAVRYL